MYENVGFKLQGIENNGCKLNYIYCSYKTNKINQLKENIWWTILSTALIIWLHGCGVLFGGSFNQM